MKTFFIISLVFSLIISGISGNPFDFFPQHMLPPIGTTFNFTFTGLISTMRVSGDYVIQSVTDQDTKTIIGYRNWQLYTGEYNGIFYGVSYKNGTYLQALIDPQTHECINVFAEMMNCTAWRNTEIVRWDSRCSLVRIDSPISGDLSLTVRASTSDLKRPVDFLGTASISGSPDQTTITYQFLSQVEQRTFADVKCYF